MPKSSCTLIPLPVRAKPDRPLTVMIDSQLIDMLQSRVVDLVEVLDVMAQRSGLTLHPKFKEMKR